MYNLVDYLIALDICFYYQLWYFLSAEPGDGFRCMHLFDCSYIFILFWKEQKIRIFLLVEISWLVQSILFYWTFSIQVWNHGAWRWVSNLHNLLFKIFQFPAFRVPVCYLLGIMSGLRWGLKTSWFFSFGCTLEPLQAKKLWKNLLKSFKVEKKYFLLIQAIFILII